MKKDFMLRWNKSLLVMIAKDKEFSNDLNNY